MRKSNISKIPDFVEAKHTVSRRHPTISIKSDAEKPKQTLISKFLKSKSFVKEEFERLLLEFIIMTDQPFHVVENQAFLRFALYGRDLDGLFSEDTLKRRIVSLYDAEKLKIKDLLMKAAGRISLVLDCWTTRHCIGFHGVIASWISADWNYEEVLLDMDILKRGHSGKELATSLVNVLEDFKILGKVLAITTDNASSCDTMFNEFKRVASQKGLHVDCDNQRVRCLAHVVNLACKDAISILKTMSAIEVDDSSDGSSNESDICEDDSQSSAESGDLQSDSPDANPANDTASRNNLSLYHRVRKGIASIRKSGTLLESFKNSCRIKKLKHRQLVLDTEVRWNSTDYMLRRLYDMKLAYDHLTTKEHKLFKYKLTLQDWDLIKDMMDLLEPFRKMTVYLSKAKIPTMALSAAVYIELYNHLESYKKANGKGEEICSAAAAACDKLNKYYPTSDGLVYVMGLILDPRCKLEWYKCVGIPSQVAKSNKKMALQHWDTFYKPRNAEMYSVEEPLDILASQVKRAKTDRRDEFREYLSMPTVESVKDNDCLTWWKEHAQSFPALAAMARDFLAVSGTG
ncbi:unnamed protein product, partial [Allacma fusca]